MPNLKTLSAEDANLYFRGSYIVTKKGTPVMVRSVEPGNGGLQARCYIKDTSADQWAREKTFDISNLVLKVPRLGYINDFENNRVVYAQRRVQRAVQRLLTNDNLRVFDAVTGKMVDVRPSLIRQMFNPSYTPAHRALKSIMECETKASALSEDLCLVYSPTADTILIKANETPAGYYEGNNLFKLLPETADYADNINRVFGGHLNVSF